MEGWLKLATWLDRSSIPTAKSVRMEIGTCIKRTLSTLAPGLFQRLRVIRRRISRDQSEYPRSLNSEYSAVRDVLCTSGWNMSYGKGLVHETLEAEFAEYVGTKHAVAVNSGGMAIQMSLRAMGVKPGDEVIHQVDTCVANAFAVLGAGATPIFADVDASAFEVTSKTIGAEMSERTKVIMPVHVWGLPVDMNAIMNLATDNNVQCIEDACLALGAERNGRKAGSFGHAGVFSFGCMKPIQAGEGGMIVTNDDALAKELRTLRHWGEMTFEYGRRDHENLAWNGRMSEIVAAVVLEQLRGYPRHLDRLREHVADFQTFLDRIPGIEMPETSSDTKLAHTQIVVRLNEEQLGLSKTEFMQRLRDAGVSVWHAAFEPITSVSFFHRGLWKDWILRGDIDRVAKNYQQNFPGAELIYNRLGLSFAKQHFMTRKALKKLMASIVSVLAVKHCAVGRTI